MFPGFARASFFKVKMQFKVNKVKMQFKVNKVKMQFKVNKINMQFKVNKVKIQFKVNKIKMFNTVILLVMARLYRYSNSVRHCLL